MTSEEYTEVMTTINQVVMDVVCPPGTFVLLAATIVVAIPGLIFLFLLS